MLARYALMAALLLLAACAAMPGYSPPPFKEKNKNAQPLESGEVQPDGQYEMSADEKAMDCKRITGSIQIGISRMKDSYGRVDPSTGAWVMQSAVTPLFGGSSIGANRQALYARERAKLDSYNRELEARNCKTVDIDAELARPSEATGKRY